MSPNTSQCNLDKDLYTRNCVYGNENAEDKISSLPVLSPEQYYDKRDGRWLTRIEYCNYLKQHPLGGRSVKFYNNLYKKNCSDRGLKSNGTKSNASLYHDSTLII